MFHCLEFIQTHLSPFWIISQTLQMLSCGHSGYCHSLPEVWVFLFQQDSNLHSLPHASQTFFLVSRTLALFMASLGIHFFFFLVFMMSNMSIFYKAFGFPVQFLKSSLTYTHNNKCSYNFSSHLNFLEYGMRQRSKHMFLQIDCPVPFI